MDKVKSKGFIFCIVLGSKMFQVCLYESTPAASKVDSLLRFIFTGMKDHIHISLPHFLEVIEKRLDEYREALFGTRQSFGMNHAMLTAKLHNMQTMKQLIDQNELTKGELWGYGINHISDGEQEYLSADVEVIKRTGGQNKHQAFPKFAGVAI